MVLPLAVEQMRAAGVTLQARDGRLAVSSPSPLTDEQVDYIRAHKDALLALLTIVCQRWHVLTDQWESHVIYPSPVTLEIVQGDYPDAESIRPLPP